MSQLTCPRCENSQPLQTARQFRGKSYEAICTRCGQYFFGSLIVISFERTEKDTALEIVYYEWDMLNFTFERLQKGKSGVLQVDWNLLIEGFLVHARNLIRFFSGREHRSDKGDVSTADPEVWARRKLTENEIKTIQAPALLLEDEHFQKISRYLQHCTIYRLTPADWQLEKMHSQIAAILKSFEAAFPRVGKPEMALMAIESDSNSTATLTVGPPIVEV